MASQEITVIARIKAKKNAKDEVKKGLQNLMNLTQKEQGCKMYQLHQIVDDDAVFIIYENWESKSDVDRHMNTPHFKGWIEKSKSLIAEPDQITLLTKI